MKIYKYIAAAVASIALLSSCSILQSVATNALKAGSNTGAAISDLAQVVKTAGNVDLGSITDIINLGQVIRGAKTAATASTSFLEKFTSGLIQGSANKINNSNVGNVISGLKTLNGLDTSALKSAAIKAAMTGAVNKVSTNDAGVSDALSQVGSILNLLK